MSVYETRRKRLVQLLDAYGLQGIALMPGPSLFYLTGFRFHLMERPILALFTVEGKAALIAPELERPRTEGFFPGYLFYYGEDPRRWPEVFHQALKAVGLTRARVGVEPTRLRFRELRLLETAAPRATWEEATEVLAELRTRKDEGEVEHIRRAVAVAEAALKATLAVVRPGMTEQEVAAELVLQLLRHGSEPELPFPPIVASGPNSANPHAMPTDRVLQPGDLVLIDWGARVEGYVSDLTRVFVLGEPRPEWLRWTRLVEEAQAAACAVARPGVPAGEVDRAARQVLEEAGYGPHFLHRTGHGMGLEAHEPPYLYGENTRLLEPGMVFTIEPGLYFPGHGGVRIEDDVVVTTQGCRVLSTLPRGLQPIGRE